MFVNIQIKSSNFNSLKQYLDLIFKLNLNNKLNFKSTFKLLKKKSRNKTYTILRSPHVNKTSQEQFECNFKVNQLNLYCFQFFKFLVILKKLSKITRFDIEITIRFRTNLKQQDQLVFRNYRVKWYKFKLTKRYLNLIDLHGNLQLPNV